MMVGGSGGQSLSSVVMNCRYLQTTWDKEDSVLPKCIIKFIPPLFSDACILGLSGEKHFGGLNLGFCMQNAIHSYYIFVIILPTSGLRSLLGILGEVCCTSPLTWTD